jgi:calcium-dependent protein kinase
LGDGIGWIIPEFGGREVLAEYEFGPTLGCGTFGVTRLVTHRKTARPWACKTICKASIAASPAAQSDVQHEVAILQHLAGHRGVVQLQGVYEDERNIHLVMELCTGGDLLDYISRFGRLQEAEAADVARVMLSTLQHCHALGVVHRDIKPENFLLGAPTPLMPPLGSAASALKMSDFGVSAFCTPGEVSSLVCRRRLEGPCGAAVNTNRTQHTSDVSHTSCCIIMHITHVRHTLLTPTSSH